MVGVAENKKKKDIDQLKKTSLSLNQIQSMEKDPEMLGWGETS